MRGAGIECFEHSSVYGDDKLPRVRIVVCAIKLHKEM